MTGNPRETIIESGTTERLLGAGPRPRPNRDDDPVHQEESGEIRPLGPVEPRYTLAEAVRIIARRTCAMEGHQGWDELYGDGHLIRLTCSRCRAIFVPEES